MKIKEDKQYYIVTYNDCYGNGDNTSVEGVMTKEAFDKWLIEHNKDRVFEQCGEEAFELYENCSTLEEAVKYAQEKLNMDEEEAEILWGEIESTCEGEDEFTLEETNIKQ